MNIQRTAIRPQTQPSRKELGREFKLAKEEFEQKAEEHFERSEHHEKWSARIGFGMGAAVLVAGAAAMAKFAPGVEGYGMAFPPVLAGAATVAAAFGISNKILASKLADVNFQQSRENLVEKRDDYRAALISEVNDEDVEAITEARWQEMRAYEDQTAKTPTNVEFRLLSEVQDLEFLADHRQGGGWIGALAHAQDDPKVFGREANTVVQNDGIHRVMLDALGTGKDTK